MRIFTSPSDLDFIQLVIPLDKNLSDLSQAMWRQVKGISDVYKKPVKRIIAELLSLRNTTLEVKL
ncbi:hypothetical protein FACS1894105_04400 [Clostridia bacterium]|nr:hypothetical protein FACS1894105_04400 [Clostridia bacterium]